MSKEAFAKLSDELAEEIPDGHSTNGRSMLQDEVLLIFLYWASGHVPFKHTAFAADWSYGVVENSVDKCIKVGYSSCSRVTN